MKKKAIIFGAGPAGLTAAYELLKKGVEPIILESNHTYVGGLSRTEKYKGNYIDIGGHRFFSKSDIVMNWWSQFMPTENEMNDKPKMLIRQRLSRIFYLRNFFPYPVTLNWQTTKNLGFKKITKIGLSYLAAKFSNRKEETLEDFFINRFGQELYRTFFKDYTEKIWGIPCDKIPAEWGAQRIKKLSLLKTVTNAFASLTRKRDISQKNTETSLIEKFFYPPHGPGEFWTLVADHIKKEGGQILMGHTVTEIISQDNQIQKIIAADKNNQKISLTGDYYFSSMPVKDLIGGLNDVPEEIKSIAANLRYRDFLMVGLLVKNFSYKKQPIADNWIYVQEPDVKVGRIQIFNNWSQEMVADKNKTWIGLEYFVNENDELWNKTPEEMIKFASAEMEKMGLLNQEDMLDATTIKILKAYPAYFGTYNEFDKIKKFTNKISNLFLIGRNGTHRYNNMDHSMLSALTAVECAISGDIDKEKIWQINTEKEYHEEKRSKNKIMTFLKNHWPEIVALTIFSAISILWLFKHEPWLDEAQAYLIARDAGGIGQMVKLMGYEGTPMLWHLMLYILIKCGGGYFSMHIMHAILAIITAAILLFWSPFPRLYKISLIFGYFFIYEYNAIARSYILSVLFIFLIAAFYKQRHKHPLIFSLMLILLSQTNIHGTMIAGTMFIFWLWEIGKNKIEKKLELKNFIYNLIAAFLIIVSFVTVIIQIKTPADIELGLPWFPVTSATQPLVAIVNAFIPIPLPQINFWNSNAFLSYWTNTADEHPNFWYLFAATIIFYGSLFIALPFRLLWNDKKTRWIYIALISNLSLIFLLLHGGKTRHYGLIWICFIFTLWLYCQNGHEPDKTSKILIATIITAQIIGSIVATTVDLKYDFSAAGKTAAYLKENIINTNNTNIIAFDAMGAASLEPFLPPATLQYLEYDKKMSYIVWNKQFGKLALKKNTELEKIIPEIINQKKETTLQKIYFLSNRPVFYKQFTRQYQFIKYFGPSIVKEESYYLYRIK